MQQQPPGWGPPQGYGPPGYPPQGYPPPGYPPPTPTPPRKKTPVALIAVGALVGVCGVCTVIGALVPKPPAPPPTPTTTTQAVAPDPAPTPSAPSVPNPPTAQNPPTPPAAPQAVAPTEQDGRQFIPQTCAEVSHLFGAQSELSELQQEETWRQYDGRWVRWRVKVVEVGETLGTLQLQFKCTREVLVSDGIASFEDDQRARLLAVRTGRTIEIVARLEDHGRLLGLSLRDASIVGP